MKSNRVMAIAWWNSLDYYFKQYNVKTYLSGFVVDRSPDSLTGREIQKIWEEKQKHAEIKLMDALDFVKNLDFLKDLIQVVTDKHLLFSREK